MDLKERIFELKLKGYCCSQIIMALGLSDLHRENPDLISAMGGLCNGFEEGKFCGTLGAAISLLYLVDPYEANKSMRADLMDWFYDRFGAYDCEEILDGNPMNKTTLCPVMVEETYEMLQEFLEDKLGG